LGGTYTGSANTSDLNYGLAYRTYTNSLYFNGIIDQVRIFDKALSQSEVDTLEAETYDSSTKSTTDIFGDGSSVALYELDEDASDTGNTGTAIDAGQSASFIGTSSNYIQLASGIDTILDTKIFGLSLWVKAPNAFTDAVFSTETTNSTFQIHANWTFANRYALINGGGSNIDLGPIDSNWHHIVVTSDGSSSYKGYFDKVYKGASAYRQIQNTGTFLGAHPSGGFNLFGEIDQVRIFNRQLSQSDIDSLYSETSPSTVDYFSDGNGKALYRLDGNANDTSGSYNATWNGTAAYSDPAYTGQSLYNGTPTNVNFLGMAFQPDLVWIKDRGAAAGHWVNDSVRGAGKGIMTQSDSAEITSVPELMSSFDSNGFTVGYISNNTTNFLNNSYVAWCWKAGGPAVAANSIEATNATRSANVDAGFSIIKFQSSASTSTPPPMNYIEHGLDSTPKMVIYKATNSTSAWRVMHVDIGQKWIELQSLAATAGPFTYTLWDNTPTSIGVRSNYAIGANQAYIAYCFAEVDGYQKVGSYTGATAGVTITTGFRPRFIMVKSTSHTESWTILDTVRGSGKKLRPNSELTELTGANYDFTTTSTGFSFPNQSIADASLNENGYNYIYLAIA
jgi:hypothetical protein